MQPQNARPAYEVQYQDYTINPGTANIVRLQPVADPRIQNLQGPQFVRLEPVGLHPEAQRVDVLPPVVDPWQPWPLNETLPTLVRASADGTEGNIVYCLKIACSQCCAVQTVPTYARLPTEDEIQQEITALAGAGNNEFLDYNGNDVDRLEVKENVGQHDQIPGRSEGSKFTYLNPDAPEFFCPQAPKTLNPEAPTFFSSKAPRVEFPEANGWYRRNVHAQNGRQNERRTRNRRYRRNDHLSSRSWPTSDSEATGGREYNSVQQQQQHQQHHGLQNQGVLPENAVLAHMFRDTTIQMLDRPNVPFGFAPVPLAFCWTPEGQALHCMSASTGQPPSHGGGFNNYR